MAANRFKDSLYDVSRGHDHFARWLFLSLAVHLIPAIVIVLFPNASRRVYHPPVYQVELMARPETVVPEGAVQKEEVAHKEEPRMETRTKVKDVGHRATKKARKETVIPKSRTRAEEAVAKLREKVAADDAVERIRKRVKEKEKVSGGGIKIAARAPSRVYHYEEMDKELQAYYVKISRMVANAWSLPEGLRNKGLKAVLSIHIRRDGAVESLWIEEGSGNKFYDESTLRAINKVSPLPPLPKAWKDESIDLGLRF